jgi:hypothetical protein
MNRQYCCHAAKVNIVVLLMYCNNSITTIYCHIVPIPGYNGSKAQMRARKILTPTRPSNLVSVEDEESLASVFAYRVRVDFCALVRSLEITDTNDEEDEFLQRVFWSVSGATESQYHGVKDPCLACYSIQLVLRRESQEL